ncbi:MAG: (2Fe-2S)-binding protein [Myxococcota bacterium]
MLVCQCRGVTDRQIRRLVRAGACSTRDVVQATGAGRDCGGCRSDMKRAVTLAVQQASDRQLRNTGGATMLDHVLAVALSAKG